MRQLDVYVNDQKAGVLTEQRPGEEYCFHYDKAYLASDSPSISVSLSKRKESYRASKLFPFFTNMLPEGANRKVIFLPWPGKISLVGYMLKRFPNDYN